MQYSYEFKAQAVEKALDRGPGVSFNSVAQSCGIDHSTLRRWVGKFQNQYLAEENMTKEKTPGQWTSEQKLQAFIACASMDEEQTSAWCRENGIFPHHVEQWRKEKALAEAAALLVLKKKPSRYGEQPRTTDFGG